MYIPELTIAYLAVVTPFAWFTTRESAVKGMEIANVVADPAVEWVRECFLETRRMREFVDALARAAKKMLELGEYEDKGKKIGGLRKRGSVGETLRVWDIGVRN